MSTFIIENVADLPGAAQYLLPMIKSCSTVALSGELGAGKTSLVKAICTQLDVIDDVSSPTFSLINTYVTKDGVRIHHVDLYRLKTLEEALEIGIEDYLNRDELTLIEWPELIGQLLPDDTLHLSLEHMDKERRKIVIL
ncbi:MAG: tRNA (adenosine(37)-N6)-threonylcarbamoyltransferase complex ATPase subunit type 1 TsaE [Saprospiraceae bacterium]|nr:tRNA (adenosine(37)-N6)-threonylcarbamoyltransferase complex ATPase subunit type 1 TsaE [Saprospiraceae bacterium]